MHFRFPDDRALKDACDSENPLFYRKVMGTATKRFGIVSCKYLRRFDFDTMTNEQPKIPESVADSIEGRTPKTVGTRHYMSLKRKAIQFYPRYAEYAESLRKTVGLF